MQFLAVIKQSVFRMQKDNWGFELLHMTQLIFSVKSVNQLAGELITDTALMWEKKVLLSPKTFGNPFKYLGLYATEYAAFSHYDKEQMYETNTAEGKYFCKLENIKVQIILCKRCDVSIRIS
jgi:hypothetical protein